VLVLPAENPAAAVYGLIAIGALLAAESGLHESYLDTVLSAVIAAGVYWLAHAYSNLLGRRLLRQEPLTPRALLQALVFTVPLVRGAAVPISALVVARLTGSSQQTAVTVALWSVVVTLLVFEVLAGMRARASTRELALDAAVGLTMGLAVLALRIVLH